MPLVKRELKCKSKNLENVTLVNIRGVNSEGQGLAYITFQNKSLSMGAIKRF